MPDLTNGLSDFTVRDIHEPLPRIEQNREILEQVYTLEPARTGKLSIGPIRIPFTDARRDGDGQPHVIETQPLSVHITTVVPSDEPSLGNLRPLAGPVEVPAERRLGRWLLLLPVAAILAAVGWFWRKRRKRTVVEKPLSPQELARLELEQLLSERWAERDVKLFYVALTGLVRRYIERTTGVRAPEQTTEEFLREIAGKETFQPEEARRLEWFLESADLVKFAAYRPRMEDIDESIDRARRFIGLERMEVTA